MNERIKELAKQAGFCGTGFHNTLPGTTQEDALKNFAELIVLECEKVSKNPKWYSESPSNGWRNPIRFVCNTFKEHFGVEV